MNILLLEDNTNRIQWFKNRTKNHHLTVCGHARAAKQALKKGTFDMIFLDHDLRGKPEPPSSDNCGSEVARFIADRGITAVVVLHTENPVGHEAMEALLPNSITIPYSTLKKIGLHGLLKDVSARDSGDFEEDTPTGG